MKIYTNYFSFCLITFFLLVCGSCKKVELLNPKEPKVINLTIEGSTTSDLEFVYKDSVVASVKAEGDGSFVRTALLNTSGLVTPEISIREAGSTDIIASRPIDPNNFKQALSIFYDSGNIYNGKVTYTIKGYVMSGELEFLLDGLSLFTGSSTINRTINILVNDNEIRQLEVRKVGEQTTLITNEIPSGISEQSLGFFYDGTEIVDGIEVAPPKNPENMAVTAQFKTTFTDPNSTTLYFTGGNEVDIVFYTRKKGTENKNRTTPEDKVDPEIRIPLPLDGTFVNFELPILTDETMEYSFDFVENGTDDMPYVRGKTASNTYPELRANQGRYGKGIVPEGGKSKLLLISDGFKSVTSPSPRHRIPIPAITDLSEYFQ
ncbi:hypothetical protein [Sphingobacterium hotanense]|uniref:hypothetical protein n=1 Tax=Sphingobacterium TaxID=28453 RepID=UPI0021A91EFE|nr:hypothetical protein [Sphingobacterium hotanense]MCT1523679.1 hypothetical protein [Sphingobacterium hotanense]